MDKTQGRRLKELEWENARLRKIVAALSLDNEILVERLGARIAHVKSSAEFHGLHKLHRSTDRGANP